MKSESAGGNTAEARRGAEEVKIKIRIKVNQGKTLPDFFQPCDRVRRFVTPIIYEERNCFYDKD